MIGEKGKPYEFIMHWKKAIRLIPFLILWILLLGTWFNILKGNYIATLKHQVALLLLTVNLVGYFFRFKLSLILTGVILLLLAFNLLAVSFKIEATSFYLGIGKLELSTPYMQSWSLLLLILFLCINLKYVIMTFRELKQGT